MARQALRLTAQEVREEGWKKLEAYYEAELAEKRRKLENPRAIESERIRLCWQIDMIKRFLSHSEQGHKNVAGAGE